jgi:hypothetical protein
MYVSFLQKKAKAEIRVLRRGRIAATVNFVALVSLHASASEDVQQISRLEMAVVFTDYM